MKREPFHCLPKFEAGCQMPSANTIIAADAANAMNAEEGSRALLRAYLYYGVRHGLPNLSRDDCELLLSDLGKKKRETHVRGFGLPPQGLNAKSTGWPTPTCANPLVTDSRRGE